MHKRVSLGLRGPIVTCMSVLAALLWVSSASPAFGFAPPIGGEGTGTTAPFNLFSCDQCHAVDSEAPPADGSGPHGHYSTTTSKCSVCHDVHNANAGGVILLRGATVSAACLTCHDGTQSGIGPYDTIEAHGGTVAAQHRTDTTNVVPGGTTNLTGSLACSDCHSVHGAGTVTAFLRDSGFAGTTYIGGADAYVTSDCLLRSDVNGESVAEYGALWCAACHDQRHSDSGTAINHPVDSAADWGYGDVVSTVTLDSWRAGPYDGSGNAIGMGRTNGGYIMAPAAEDGDGRVAVRRDPMCQQCHEDARNVTEVFSADYTYRGTDPWNTPVNPEFVTFPHQTTNPRLLVETYDDLCLNCHPVSGLP